MLSIDIGSKKVCIADGVYHNGTVTVNACAEIEYDNEIVVNGYINDRPALSFLLNEIIKTNRMKSRSAIVTVNSSDIITRDLRLPNVKAQNLKMLVGNEMIRIIKENNEFIIDYIVNGTTEDNMLSITAYAMAKEIVEGYYKLLKELKLTPVALDIHANSTSKLFTNTTINGESYNEENIILADIGYSKISFHGFSGGVCRFNRTDLSPVQEFVREIASINRVDLKNVQMDAVNLSPQHVHDNPIIGETCKYFTYRLAEEIQRYIQYLIMNAESKSVSRVFLFGGIASAKGIGTALTESLKIKVEPIESIGKLTIPATCKVTKICNAAGALIRYKE